MSGLNPEVVERWGAGGVESVPTRMSGQPVVTGTRLTVETLWVLYLDGHSVDQLGKSYPFVTREQIEAALRYRARVCAVMPLHADPLRRLREELGEAVDRWVEEVRGR